MLAIALTFGILCQMSSDVQAQPGPPRVLDAVDWQSVEHALKYLSRADTIPHRREGEACLVELLSRNPARILDLGSGGGRLLELLGVAFPRATFVAVDFSAAMIEQLRGKFGANQQVQVLEHDMREPLPKLGAFDAVVSCFAIHHLEHERKRGLYAEIYRLLRPGGIFCNLEHVASPTERLHADFYKAIGFSLAEEDKSNKLLPVEPQLQWLREIGFDAVDCFWKWRELALLAGTRPE